MEYVCDHMKRIVIYDQDTISITLERCGNCIGCLKSKAETPSHSCEALEEIDTLATWIRKDPDNHRGSAGEVISEARTERTDPRR